MNVSPIFLLVSCVYTVTPHDRPRGSKKVELLNQPISSVVTVHVHHDGLQQTIPHHLSLHLHLLPLSGPSALLLFQAAYKEGRGIYLLSLRRSTLQPIECSTQHRNVIVSLLSFMSESHARESDTCSLLPQFRVSAYRIVFG